MTESIKQKPWHPYTVLAAGMVLPGAGQVINGMPMRGLLMLFYMILLGVVTYHLTTPAQSIFGRYAGGWFVYGISFLDAYRTARYRWEYFRRYGTSGPPQGQ